MTLAHCVLSDIVGEMMIFFTGLSLGLKASISFSENEDVTLNVRRKNVKENLLLLTAPISQLLSIKY